MGMLWFIEEANLVFAKNSEGRFDLGDGPVLGALRTARKITIAGETSVFVIDQTPSKLHPTTLANCQNFIIFRLTQSQDVREAGNGAGLEPHQLKEPCQLSEREVVVRFDRCRRALKLQVDDITLPKALSREQARARSKTVLDKIPFVEKAGEKEGGARTREGGLPPDERRWYAHFVREPWLLKQDRMKATGLNKDADDAMRDKFEARGCVAFDCRMGAKWKVYRPTPRGVELANSLKLGVGSPRKGSIGHECMAVYLERSLEEYFSQEPREPVRLVRVGAASTTDGVQPDLLTVRADGSRFTCQVCHRNQSAYEAAAVLKLHELALAGPGHADRIDFVLAVARNKGHKKAIEKAIRERNNGSVPHKVVILDFDGLVKVDWDDVFASVD